LLIPFKETSLGQRNYRIVVLNTHVQLSASFDDAPERGFGGATAREAAQRLIKAAGRLDLDEEQVLEIGSTECDGRLDFVVRVS
jgi:hypothetical protein